MTNTKLLNKIAKQELQQRESVKLPDVLSECFTQQLDFIHDSSKRKVLCIPRRSGKSTAVALYLINEALKHEKSKLLYVHLTKNDAKRVMWGDIFETIFLKLNIDAELIESKYEIRFKNGSIIYLTGTDATSKEMNKLRGTKYRLAAIDECQSFTSDLRQLILQVLTPTLADLNATLLLCGTPGSNLGTHYWWLVNKPDSEETGWKFFKWSWKDNPHVRDNMQKQVDEMLATNPLISKTPWFRQEYLGEWVPETDARVYKSEAANYINEVPNGLFKGSICYILGIDLGYYDSSAFTIGCYNKSFDNNLYILESFKQSKLTITDVANVIKELRKKYPFTYIVIDAANAQAVSELRMIHSLPLTASEKTGKESHIAILNSDFITQNVKIVKQANEALIEELSTLTWDHRALLQNKHKEDARKENHLVDSLLYTHRFSRHYWFKAPIPIPQPDDYIIDQIEKRYGAKKSDIKYFKKPFWEMEDEY